MEVDLPTTAAPLAGAQASDAAQTASVSKDAAAVSANGRLSPSVAPATNGGIDISQSTSSSDTVDSAMQDASTSAVSTAALEGGARFASPRPRASTPAVSEAASDTGSAATSNGGPPGANFLELSASIDELPFPLSAYTFANTTLVPVASTSTHPFDFQGFPAQILEESWNRSKRADDPEAYEPIDREAGYHATAEEMELSASREAARKERIQAKLYPWKGKAKEVLVPMGRASSKSRAMEKSGSVDSATSAAPRRGRQAKSTLQQEVRAPSPPLRASTQAAPPARPPPTQAPTRTFGFTTRFDEPDLVNALLPDNAQTAKPVYLEPHPAFINLDDLPSHYIPEASAPASTRQAPAETGSFASRRTSTSRSSTSASQTPAAASANASASPAKSRAPSKAAAPSNIAPPAKADPYGDTESTGRATGTKRTRGVEDEGKAPTKKKAKEEKAASQQPDEPEPPLGPPVSWQVQTTTCLSKKVDGQTRCFQCIARSIGHGCSFLGVRSFGLDYLGRICTEPEFRSSEEPDDAPNFDKSLTKALNSHDTELLKTWTAPSLSPILKNEYRQANLPDAIKIRRDLTTHSLCDTCNTALLGAQYMCASCGRVACKVCLDHLRTLEVLDAKMKPLPGSGTDQARRRKCIAKKRGKDASGAEVHFTSQFIPLSTFAKAALKPISTAVTAWDRGRQLAATDQKTYDYLRRKFCVPSNLVTYDVNTRPINTVPYTSLTEPIYFELWRMGEPVLVRKIPRGDMEKYTPDWFGSKFANTRIDIFNNYGTETHPSVGNYFFTKFSKPDFTRQDGANVSYRIKDFPTPKQWQNEMKELKNALFETLPLPNVFRPNGIYNMLAHTPTNALQPDLGPRLTASWETNAKWPTTMLRTDCTDVASYMFWGGKDKESGKPLRVRWDVFHIEDVEKLREFCWDVITRKLPKGQNISKYKEQHDDPLLFPQVYLTKSLRAELFTKHNVKPFPIYQFEGDMVCVPAGCPYQVSSWVDHLSLTISYLSGARVKEAIATNEALQLQTKERSIWRQDNVQLESQLYWTWQASDRYDTANPRANYTEAEAEAYRARERVQLDRDRKERRERAADQAIKDAVAEAAAYALAPKKPDASPAPAPSTATAAATAAATTASATTATATAEPAARLPPLPSAGTKVDAMVVDDGPPSK